MKKVFAIFTILICAAIFASILPYPIFSPHTNISEQEAFLINNHRESEMLATRSQEVKILDANFSQIDAILPLSSKFEVLDMSTGQSFLAERTGGVYHFDVQPATSMDADIVTQIATQINGKESVNLMQNQLLLSCRASTASFSSPSNSFSTPDSLAPNKNPVLSKISASCERPAQCETSAPIWSWARHSVLVKLNECAYLPASIAYYPHGYTTSTNFLTGHLCIHFAGSRMDGTKKVDNSHQKCVDYARKNGKKFLQEHCF